MYRSTEYIIALLFWMLFSGQLFCQEQIGLRSSTYAGMHGAHLNPASTAHYPLQWEVGLFSAAAFFENNFAFITNTSTGHLLNNAENIEEGFRQENPPTSNFTIDFSADTSYNRFANLELKVNGPSILFRPDESQAIGAFFNARFASTTNNIPGIYNYYYLADKAIGEPVPLIPSKTAAMVWTELGIHYSKSLETYSGKLSIGANVKYLQGYEALFANLGMMTYSMSINSDTINVEGIDVDFGYTNSNLDMIDGADLEARVNGRGVGIDIGVNYIVDGYEDNYLYKIGISFLDIGAVRFNRNTEVHKIDTEIDFELSESLYQELTTADELTTQISNDALGTATASFTGTEFLVATPAAVALQGDFNILEGFFISGLWLQGIPIAQQQVNRESLINITPRYEHKWGEIHFPISMYSYKTVNVGLSLRLGLLTIGTDNLGSFLRSKEYTGTDFYVGLKLFSFGKGLSIGGINFGGRGKKVKCYDF